MADEDAGRSRNDGDAGGSRGSERAGGARDRELGADGPDDPGGDDPDDSVVGPKTADFGSDDAGLGFSLPPISLPEMHLPERVRLVFPVPDPPEKVARPIRVEASWVVIAVAFADALDALAVAWAGPETLAWARAAAGVLAAVVLVGGPGLLYAWELLAILGGMGALSLAPTLTALVLGRLILSQ